MNERERWIVYPLLFLALGSALRDKLFDQTRSKIIVCEELAALNVRAGTIDADNYVYRGNRFAPTLLKAMPGISPSDWLRALQQSADALQQGRSQDAAPAENGDQDAVPESAPSR